VNYISLLNSTSVLVAISIILVCSSAPATAAEDRVVAERRVAISQYVDFYGSDLSTVFDTTLSNCEQLCLRNKECKAYTFNSKSNACFLKSAITERKPFDGAISGELFDTNPTILENQRFQLKSLGFLHDYYLDSAATQSHTLARRYPTNGQSEELLLDRARQAEAKGNVRDAFELAAAAIGATDNAEVWNETARLSLMLAKTAHSRKWEYLYTATSSSINGYIRSINSTGKSNSLLLLSEALQLRNEGRLSIPALRLAQSLAPRFETEEALDRAILLFGFRIVRHDVNNNTKAPRICMTFSESLMDKEVDYSNYVRLPLSGLATDVNGNQLCIDGVKHGKRYRFSLREGLPASNGETLQKTIDMNIYVKDRDPSVRFTSRAYVLPRSKNTSLPIVSVNLENVDLKIFRVGDRNIIRSIQDDFFARSLPEYREEELANSLGVEVWNGTGKLKTALNQDVTTQLPIGDALSSFEPGVYVLSARVPGIDIYNADAATQWFVVTDLGLTSMTGSDGLHVFVRSLGSAEVLEGVSVKLVSQSNNILAEAKSNENGYVHFAPGLIRGLGGSIPALLTASNNTEDFAFLSLRDAPFDLSDRGVEGRNSPSSIDIFLSTDRGAYRVGETVHATALVRDQKTNAIEDLPLTAIVTRPDGVEYSRELLKNPVAGGYTNSVQLPNNAQRGTWNLRLFVNPNDTALASRSFLVEDFLPDRIEFDLSLPKTPLNIEDLPELDVHARYLYGAPGAGLSIDGSIEITSTRKSDDYPGYVFGRADEDFALQVEYFSSLETDDDGKASIALPTFPVQTSRLLKMQSNVLLREGSGRPVERQISRNLAPNTIKIGIKPLFNGTLAQGLPANFTIISIGPDSQRLAQTNLKWSLHRLTTQYQWYTRYGDWDYEPVVHRELISNGVIDTTEKSAGNMQTQTDWGQYELRVESSSNPQIVTTYKFYAGWYVPTIDSDTPDTLQLGLDKSSYKVGEVVQLRIAPRYTGKAQISVLNNRLIETRMIDVVQGENLINIDVSEDWGSGAYITASVIRPMDIAAGHNPARSLGLSWAAVDPGKRRLTARFRTPDEVEPRGSLNAALTIEGLHPGESAFATIAAIDVGVLNLTGFTFPDPDTHYFGQQKLGMALRDVYGRLIDGIHGSPGQVRSGGDASAFAAMRMASPPSSEHLLSFFSGPLKVDKNGQVNTDFALPDFNGTVRLMAIVWSKSSLGQATKDITIRNPVVLTTSLPRFLSPNDQSRALIEIAHVSGPAGNVSLEIGSSNGLHIDQSAIPENMELGELKRVQLSVPISAREVGENSITVTIKTPDGKKLDKRYPISIRANDPLVSHRRHIELESNGTFILDAAAFSDYHSGTGHATLAMGPLARFDVPGLLSALDRYPYGCTEQITSQALPLLYFKNVASQMGLGNHSSVEERITQAISDVLLNQAAHGGFGLWNPGGGDLWLDAYVSDFLSRAKAEGYGVPENGFRLAIDNLRNAINYAGDFEKGGETIAYSLMVLAREGAAAIGDLRYYADVKSEAFATPLALAQLATALFYYGEKNRSENMFRQASELLESEFTKREPAVWRTDYGSQSRDAAAILALAAEAGSKSVNQSALIKRITRVQTVSPLQSTQENSWTLLAANALLNVPDSINFSVNGEPANRVMLQVLDAQTDDSRSISIVNNSENKETLVLSSYGLPDTNVPAGGYGYKIERQYFNMDGENISLKNVPINSRIVVVLKITPERSSKAQLMINDPLPAGFEIDNPNILRSGSITQLDWLNLNIEPVHSEFRTERFLAAVDWASTEVFHLAYMARAISPGTFHHPAASVEDMYRPQFRARTATSSVRVVE